ncbi:hypothetical protein FNV43_RR08668 [Rhamnella rubrinervis]|uniref:Non-specific lipid-transfer protein n=1 Tax=Rhamnella rubrinervis TaxID=2594499 RepID=A0A8K0H8M4_9ROSA|nr:hypothetical protein FNV43_RR08668 [Rhamnella rubrinervis]
MASSLKLLVCMGVMLMVVCAPSKARALVTCNQVVGYLTPCIPYVQNGGAVPVNCCNGIKTLYGLAQTTQDRQGVCNCLKQVVKNVPYTGPNVGLAAGLPSKCGLNIPYKISPSTDCQNEADIVGEGRFSLLRRT